MPIKDYCVIITLCDSRRCSKTTSMQKLCWYPIKDNNCFGCFEVTNRLYLNLKIRASSLSTLIADSACKETADNIVNETVERAAK